VVNLRREGTAKVGGRENFIDNYGVNIMRKGFLVMSVCILFFTVVLFAGIGMSAPEAQASDAWKDVVDCHDAMRSTIKGCSDAEACRNKKMKKTIKKAAKNFKKCVKKVTKDAKLRKGSSFKKLSKSVQKVVDAVQPIFRKCNDNARAYEKEAVKKAKKKGNLKEKGKKIKKKADGIRTKCFEAANKQSMKAMEAQIRQHFAK
jgi:hypothetical protein